MIFTHSTGPFTSLPRYFHLRSSLFYHSFISLDEFLNMIPKLASDFVEVEIYSGECLYENVEMCR
jgi:hypothetical protein